MPVDKISVIIPTINNLQYLQLAVDSVFRCYDPNKLEIIIVDNGSTDLTPEYLKKLKEVYPDIVKIVTHKENTGFCKGINSGIEVSTGNFILFFNDDAVMTTPALKVMLNSLLTPYPIHPNIGLVSPMSNNAAGTQSNEATRQVRPEEAEDYANNMLVDPKILPDLLSGFLSGFCLLVKREVIDKIGPIDERFSPGGFCDNSFVLDAINAGFGALVSNRAFVYHYGSKTLDKLYPELSRGVNNWHTFFSKYHDDKPKTLLMTQRVKIDTEKQLETFKKCIAKNLPYVDGVVILSDRSDSYLFNYRVARELFGDKLVRFLKNNDKEKFDEIRDRLNLYKTANNLDFDWVITFDHDECFSNITRGKLQEMMHPLNPTVKMYSFLLNNFWRSEDMVRVDGVWGQTFVRRMWQNKIFPITLRPKIDQNDPGLHCGNRPMSIPDSMTAISNVILNHYGYTDPDEIKRKKKFYEELDTSPDEIKQILVGPNGYAHLDDESDMQLIVPKPFDISLNLMVKNEETHMGILLMQFFSLIDEYVILDTGSTDKTTQYLDEVKIPYYKVELKDNFADIRNKAIELSTKKYCFHIDADETPKENFQEKLVMALNRGPDIVFVNLFNFQKNSPGIMTKQPRLFRRCKEIFYAGRIHETLHQSLKNFKYIRDFDPDMMLYNSGFLADDEKIRKKLEFYARLLELEIKDNPKNEKAYLELGAHYRNLGEIDKATELYKKSIEIDPKNILALRELSLVHVSKAFDYIKRCAGGKVSDANIARSVETLYADLKKWEDGVVKIGA